MQISKVANHHAIIDDDLSTPVLISLVSTSPLKRIRLWDLPTRIFHWTLVVLVSIAVVSGEVGGEWMGVHGKAGLSIVGLITFRLIWGVIGSSYARFTQFAPGVSKLRAYFKGQWKGVGHNPLGALSVFALLALLAAQATTGLFSNNDIDFNGPLFNLVDQAVSNRLTGIHQYISYALFAILAVHVLAISFYVLIKKNNLVKPMVTGWKEVREGKSATKGGVIAFSVALILSLGVVYAVSGLSLRDIIPSSISASISPSPTSTTNSTISAVPASETTPTPVSNQPPSKASPSW